MISIINNLESNHFERLRSRIRKADEVTFVSPFLYSNFKPLLSKLNLSRLKTFNLITTLIPKSVDQLRKADSLSSLVDFLETHYPKVKLRVRIDNKLHGKIYLFKEKGTLFSGIISSANLTEPGLKQNHEWGVEITESNQLQEIENSIESACQHI